MKHLSLLCVTAILGGTVSGQDATLEQEIQLVAGHRCEDCHVSESWDIIDATGFDHSETRFPLEGQHLLSDCQTCHAWTDAASVHNFRGVSSDCFSCHQDIHKDELGDDCQSCHNPDSWRVQRRHSNTMKRGSVSWVLTGESAARRVTR